MVVENALKAEPKSTSCPAGSGIQCIATPLHAPVTEIVHRIAKHQIHRLGRASRMPQRQTKPDRSDFNDPLLRLNIEKACLTTCFPAFRWSNGIVDLILPRGPKTPLPTSKDPTGGSPRFGARLRFHATPRTDRPHAAPRRAAPASRSDQQERYGLARAPMADVQLLPRTAVVDMFWIRPNLAFTQRKYK